MSVLNCECPTTGPLNDFIVENCKFDITQVAKMVFYRTGNARFDDLNATVPGTMGIPTPPGDQQAMLLADWQTFITATDDSKMVVTPKIGGNPVFAAADANTVGGDNSTLNGAVIVTDYPASTFDVDFYNLSPEQAAQFIALGCEGLSVIFLMKNGKILAKKGEMNANTPPAPTIEGFEVLTLIFTDLTFEGMGSLPTHHLQLQFEYGWFSQAIQFKPTWNPLTSL